MQRVLKVKAARDRVVDVRGLAAGIMRFLPIGEEREFDERDDLSTVRKWIRSGDLVACDAATAKFAGVPFCAAKPAKD